MNRALKLKVKGKGEGESGSGVGLAERLRIGLGMPDFKLRRVGRVALLNTDGDAISNN